MQIYETNDYKAYVRARIRAMPKAGRGEWRALAEALRIHPTRISHIFKGNLELSLEQASLLCRYWGLSQVESEYFLLLVQMARAGNTELREILMKQAEGLRERAAKLENRVVRDKILTESEKAIFYSTWLYSALRLSTSIESCRTLDALAEKFELPREKIREMMDFLVESGLCDLENGEYRMQAKRTHVEADSVHAQRHHANWRLQALLNQERFGPSELSYTCPVSLNRADQKRLRGLITKTIEEFLKTVTASEPPEMLACLNIDWFEV